MGMRKASGFWRLCTAFAFIGLTSGALAQGNLLTNSGFDVDLSGWENPNNRSAIWTEGDASGSPLSGAAVVANVGPGNDTAQLVLVKCVRVTGSTEYDFGGQLRVPIWQPTFIAATIVIETFDSGDCSGPVLQIQTLGTSRVDDWEIVGSSTTTASTSGSALVGLGVFKPSGVDNDTIGVFDNIYFRHADGTGSRIIDEHLSGSWFNPAQPGQGFFLDISPQINLFFGGWFTWTQNPGEHDWMTVQGGFSGDLAEVMIYRTSGGVFIDPTAVTSDPIGIAEFRFQSCTQGEVRFAFFNARGAMLSVIPLQRIAPAFNGCSD